MLVEEEVEVALLFLGEYGTGLVVNAAPSRLRPLPRPRVVVFPFTTTVLTGTVAAPLCRDASDATHLPSTYGYL